MSAPVPEALAPPPGEPRFPALDGVRGLAAVAIVVFHVGAYSHYNSVGALGAVTSRLDASLAVFFLLSGFLLYRPFAAARMTGRPAPSAGRYLRRRLLRIVPAYWAALVLLNTWPGLGGEPLSAEHWWRYVFFLQNLSLDTVNQGIGPAWTLCVELVFYLLLPVYAAAVARLLAGRTAPVRVELAVLAALATVSVALRWWALAGGPDVLLFTTPVFVTWFSAGMALAILSAERPDRVVRPAWCWCAALVVLLVLAEAVGLPRRAFEGTTVARALAEHLGYLLLAALVLAPAVFAGERRIVRALLAGRVATWLGVVSYGIYLYHLPLVLEAAPGGAWRLLAVGGGAAVACATVSYLLLERPILRLKEPRRARTG